MYNKFLTPEISSSIERAEDLQITPAPLDVSNPFEAALDADLWDRAGHAVSAPSRKPVSVRVIPDPAVDDVNDLVNWLSLQKWSDFAQSLCDQVRAGRSLTDRQVNAAKSMRAKCEARKAERTEPAAAAVDLEPKKIYRVKGEFYKTVLRRDGLGVYAKKLSGRDWIYDSSFIRVVKKAVINNDAELLTAEMAKEFGAAFNFCMMCGADLTNPQSVQRGFGPTCAKKYNLK